MICSVVRRVFFTMTPPLPENHRIRKELLHGGPTRGVGPYFLREPHPWPIDPLLAFPASIESAGRLA